MNVSDIMVKDPVVVELPTTREEVLTKMVKHKMTGLPVIDSDKKILGIITRKNIFQNPGEEQVAVIMQWSTPTVSSSTPVERAARIMLEENARRLPVVKQGKVIGLITPPDMLRVVEKRRITRPVEEFLRSPPVCIYKATPASVALDMINLSKVYAMPVLDDKSKLCGIITDRDLFNFKYLGDDMTMTTLGIIHDEDSWTWEGLRNVMNLYYQEAKIKLPREPVEKFMSKKPVTVYLRSPSWEAARIMRARDFDQLPVMDIDDRLTALISDIDLLKGLIE